MKRYFLVVLMASLLSIVNLNATEKGGSVSEYNPFEEMQKMRQEMDAVFEKFHRRMFKEDLFVKFNQSLPTTPAVDLKDMGKSYQLKVDIPGSDENEIKITTENGMLKILAKNSKIKEEKREDFIKKERFVGSYMRALSLPSDADTDKLKSNYKNGVLEITIPKK